MFKAYAALIAFLEATEYLDQDALKKLQTKTAVEITAQINLIFEPVSTDSALTTDGIQRTENIGNLLTNKALIGKIRQSSERIAALTEELNNALVPGAV